MLRNFAYFLADVVLKADGLLGLLANKIARRAPDPVGVKPVHPAPNSA
jgi:hypothetical protein